MEERHSNNQTTTVSTRMTGHRPKTTISKQKLRDAIPSHCFQASWTLSIGYIARDICFVVLLSSLAYLYIPSIPSLVLRCIAWIVYGLIQGLVFTGLWTIGHELGHGSTFPSQLANDTFGFVIHSFLLTPFFSWQSVHRKHHRYTGHMQKDTDHVPVRYEDSKDPTARHFGFLWLSKLDDYVEDAPLYVLGRLMVQQLFGWPLYLTYLIASGSDSHNYRTSTTKTGLPSWLGKCLFNPFAIIYRQEETLAVIASDIGVGAFTFLLWKLGMAYGFDLVFLLYIQPYLWTNHWIVAITFLHHTHPEVPKFEADAWTFVKGATATIDRDSGPLGRFLLHNIIDYHVVHHLFPRIPFYHAPEATRAIRPVLGVAYHRDTTNFIRSLWREFSTCQWVVSDDAKRSKDRALWFIDAEGKIPSTRVVAIRLPEGKSRLVTWL